MSVTVTVPGTVLAVGDDATTSAGMDDDVTPPSSCSPPDMADAFMSQVGLNPDMWGGRQASWAFDGEFCINIDRAFQAEVILPLHDAARCLAGSVGSSITAVSAGIVKHAKVVIQPSSPPSTGFFVRDPVAQVSTSLNFAMMSTLIKDKCPPVKPYVKRPAAAALCAAAAPASTASTSKDTKGKGYGRNSRGRGGSQK